jgi:hypothetical protein
MSTPIASAHEAALLDAWGAEDERWQLLELVSARWRPMRCSVRCHPFEHPRFLSGRQQRELMATKRALRPSLRSASRTAEVEHVRCDPRGYEREPGPAAVTATNRARTRAVRGSRTLALAAEAAADRLRPLTLRPLSGETR